jgi:hypothetical protein
MPSFREAFLAPPLWTVSSRYGAHRLAGADPVVLCQDLVIALDPARGVNNGSPSLHANPAPLDRCWFADEDWALCRDEST